MIEADLKLAWRNLARERRRTLISLAAVMVGVVGYVLAGGFIDWIFWAIREAAIQTGLGQIQISARGFHDSGLADPRAYLIDDAGSTAAKIERLPGVVVVTPRLLVSGLASHGEITVPFAGEGGEPANERRISKVLSVTGEPLDAAVPNGVMLGRGLAEALNAGRGDRIALLTSVSGGGLSGVDAIVRGVFSTGVRAYDDIGIRMPLTLAQKLARTRGVHLLVVGLDNTNRTADVARKIMRIVSPDDLEVRTWEDLSDFYRKSVTLLSRQLHAAAGLIAVILVLSIANLLTMATLERTGEIGTMLAMGTPRVSILRMHLAEGILLGVVGAIAGVVVGSVLAWVISWIGIPMPPPPGRESGYRAEILLSIPIVTQAVLLAVASAGIASAYPAWKASRMPIVDALRFNR